ncbi:MAG: hypothetical protein Q8K68_13175 [Nitrospirota bacterium]|nr:hypothetical protein [Nitrospirota bacterium]
MKLERVVIIFNDFQGTTRKREAVRLYDSQLRPVYVYYDRAVGQVFLEAKDVHKAEEVKA